MASLGSLGGQVLALGISCVLEPGYMEALQILVAMSVGGGGGTWEAPASHAVLGPGLRPSLLSSSGQGTLPCPHPCPRG